MSAVWGANTGVGGRIRDIHATGKGAYLPTYLAGYCVGNIDIDQLFNYANSNLVIKIH